MNNSDYEEIFGGNDFVYTERTLENGEKEFIGGGFKIDSFFLNNGVSLMSTYDNIENLVGGKKSDFEYLAVPAGLFYVNVNKPNSSGKCEYTIHEPVSDDIFEQLYQLVESDKKRKRNTRKRSKDSNNHKKTHKHK